MSKRLRIGIIGCGAIGSALATVIDRDYGARAQVVGLVDVDRARAAALAARLHPRPVVTSLPQLIRRCDLVIEAAGVAVAPRVCRLGLAAGRDVLIMSTGGLLSQASLWPQLAQRSRGALYVPSGALCGLDGIKAMAGTIRRLRLTTRKPPRALGITRTLRAPTLLFRGSPADAIKRFPQNTNVAATMMLTATLSGGRRPAATVRVIADPALKVNTHELEVDSDCGTLRVRVQSRPSTSNPKTSELAIRSALATLRQVLAPVRVGT